jgi:tetratricopeptide (TPR) repeat protein
MARGNIDAAKDWFTQSLAIDPAYPLAVSPMFTLLAGGFDLAGGEALLRRAADFEPDSAQVQALHGAALTFLDRPAEALAAFDRALAITPDDPELLYQSANMLQNLERQAEAVVRLNRAIALDPYNPAPRFSRGTSLAITGHNAEARADFERVLELDTSGTQYGSMATSFIDILDGLDAAAKSQEPATP